MKAGPGKAIVKVGSTRNDRIVFESGVEIFIDFQSYQDGNTEDLVSNEMDYVRTYGEVVYMCEANGNKPTLAADDKDEMIPSYRLPIDVNVGETIHFNYLSIDKDRVFFHNNMLLYPVMVDDIYAYGS